MVVVLAAVMVAGSGRHNPRSRIQIAGGYTRSRGHHHRTGRHSRSTEQRAAAFLVG